MRALALAWLVPALSPAAAQPSPATPDPVLAPPVPQFSLDATLGATDQAATAHAGPDQADLPLMLRPRLKMARNGGLAWALDASATLTGSAAGRTPLRARPDVDATLRASLVDRLLSVEAAARLHQVEIDPFGPRADVNQAANQRTEQSYRMGPVARAEPWPGGLLLARHTNLLTVDNAGTRDTLTGAHTEFTLAQAPAPLGGGLSLSRLASRLRGIPSSDLVLETGRLTLAAAPDPDIELGIDGGADRTHTQAADRTDPLWALRAAWQPSERTRVSGALENRFFGHGGEFTLRERLPWMNLVLTTARLPTLVLQSEGSGGGDLRAALDAILTTRVPDPAARDTLVDSLVSGLGLDTGGFGPVDVQTTYPQIQTRNEASWTMLSARSSVTLQAYERTYRVLRRRGEPLAAGVAVADDNRQRGLSLQANRRLTPVLSIDLLCRVSRIEGLAADDPRRSTDALARLWFTRQVSSRTSMTFGGQLRNLRSTQSDDDRGRSVLLFVGIADRF